MSERTYIVSDTTCPECGRPWTRAVWSDDKDFDQPAREVICGDCLKELASQKK